MERRLYRSRRDCMIGGVAGGLGQYLGIDPVIVRLFFVLLVLAGAGVLLYVILWIVVPEEPRGEGLPGEPGYRALDVRQRNLLIGGALIFFGLLLLAKELGDWYWLNTRQLWPLLLVAAGVALLLGRARSDG